MPKPIGLMTCNDDRGREVLDACRLAEVNVPEEAAVIGVDNDEVFCDLADPPLSSVAFNTRLGGYQAAELLHQMMTRRQVKDREVVIEPLRVIARRSTDAIAVADREVAAVLAFIRRTEGRASTSTTWRSRHSCRVAVWRPVFGS